jgi:uncharacterized protein YqgV (UPF0045/DUF77 family)
MQAHFIIYLLDSSPLRQDVAEIMRALQGTSLDFQAGPMGTKVQGDWDEVMAAIHHCHQDLARKHERVLTTIVIDDEQNPVPFSNNSVRKEVQSCRVSS